MANKPAPKNWNDVQIAIATGSMALTLAFWNMFAGPDRDAAIKHAQEQAALPPPQPQTAQQAQPVAPTTIQVQPAPQSGSTLPTGPILLGGAAPQTQITVNVGGGGGGGGGGAATSTGSS